MTKNVAGCPPICFSLFHLFGIISGTLQPLLACYILFRVVPFLQATTSQNVLNQLHVDFITKDCKCCYKKGQLKVGQVLQIGAGIPKRDNFFLKKRGNIYKVMQNRRQMRETGESNRF